MGSTINYYEVLGVDRRATPQDLKESFRKLSLIFHPDRNPGDASAEKKMRDINEAYSVLGDPDKRKYYDTHGCSKPAPAAAVFGEWVVTDPFAAEDVCDLYKVRSSKTETEAILKIARHPSSNDLMIAEAGSLKVLAAKDKEWAKRYPTLFGSLEASGRRANIISAAPNDLTPLSKILESFPKGLDFRHIVWMMNRSLDTIIYQDICGIVHGAATPSTMLFGPLSHDMWWTDFCYSVQAGTGKHIPAVSPLYKGLYPKEVFRKQVPTPVTDLYMVAKTLQSSAAEVPRRFRGILELMMAESPRARPNDFRKLKASWKELAKEEYGPPAYVPLVVK